MFFVCLLSGIYICICCCCCHFGIFFIRYIGAIFFFIVFSISKHSKNTGIVHLVVENATVISIFIVLSIIEKIVSSILFEWFSFFIERPSFLLFFVRIIFISSSFSEPYRSFFSGKIRIEYC